MRCSLAWLWRIAGLLVLGGGCQNMDRLPPADPNPPSRPASVEPDELPGGFTPASFRTLAAVPPGPTLSVSSWVAPAQTIHSEGPPPAASIGRAIRSLDQESSAACVHLERPSPLPLVVVPATRSICAHAPDYRWLVGCLEFDHHNRWSVHYADDGNDPHEGVLELVNPGPMAGFCHGQMVRVEGELVDPAPFEIKPGYRVFSLQVVRR